eukprot:scaffold80887_cov75-Phaeocystis_antarctica.AAC.3
MPLTFRLPSVAHASRAGGRSWRRSLKTGCGHSCSQRLVQAMFASTGIPVKLPQDGPGRAVSAHGDS